MSSELSEMVPKNKPFTFEGLDIRPSFRANDAGAHTYSVNIMVTEEQWNALKTIPRHRMIGGVLYWYEDASELPPTPELPEKEVQPKKSKKEPKGEFSEYWRMMVIKGIKTYPDLQDFLNCSIEDVWEALHEFFGVTTMATVSPMEWDAFVTKHHLNPGLIDISRNAALEASVNMQRKLQAASQEQA